MALPAVPPELNDWAKLVGAGCGIATFFGILVRVGYGITVKPVLARIEHMARTAAVETTLQGAKLDAVVVTVDKLKEQVLPNGVEHVEASPDDKGLALRTLVLRSRREQHDIDEMLTRGTQWMHGHDVEHARRDPTWQPGKER